MATWVLHQHDAVASWVNAQSRAGHAGLRHSFDTACKYAEDDTHWAAKVGIYAYVDYVPGKHPTTFPLILKLRVEALCVIVVGVVMPRENLAFKFE
ncbi:hypothetical protein A6A04_13535 [Paramagnetospirillum marisnigri]|uniref:Uncharacterized protein n=1 Tax=Paramagnetospirillum marisnigri TaxID=1285242 RepID=A0A178MUG0_9PROT|nr:hypothetical protein A6A04_13535 [Paramagnetospirillum marisnigri]